jgi:hypothetical protein
MPNGNCMTNSKRALMEAAAPLASGVDWAMWEAIGTVSAVVVALGLAALPSVRRWWSRPKLSLIAASTEPHCVAVSGQDHIISEVVMRIEVRNSGRRVARGLTAKVTHMWIEDLPVEADDFPIDMKPYRSEGWRLRHEEPVALRWASSDTVTIPAGESEFVSLVSFNRTDYSVRLLMLDAEHSTVKPDLRGGLHRHRLRVVVTADECEPVVEVVEFVIDGKNFISQVSIAAAPATFEDARLLTLLRRLAENPPS